MKPFDFLILVLMLLSFVAFGPELMHTLFP
jgi:hypothetical protein